MKEELLNTKFWYHCSHCGKRYEEKEVLYLCPECSILNSDGQPPKGVLKTIYNYVTIRSEIAGFQGLDEEHFSSLLPVKSIDKLPQLKIGNTPLYAINNLYNKVLPFHLYLKDDSQNPTYSFKDRASGIVSAYAKERGFNTIVTASTGNAGSSLAGICASQGQKAIVIVPEDAPTAKLTQIMMYGGRIVPVKGNYDDAFDLSIKASGEFGWYNRNTAYNPLTIEGKKTVAFELFRQMDFSLPDRIFIPVGDGVIISGVYKGFEDLLELGYIKKIPILLAVQSTGSDNLVRNIDHKEFIVKNSNTIADSISVNIPRNFHMTRQYIQKYNGETISVSDEDILMASRILAEQSGLYAEPAAAAAFAGFLAYKDTKRLEDNSRNVVLLTGSGLKDLAASNNIVQMPGSIYPGIDELIKFLA